MVTNPLAGSKPDGANALPLRRRVATYSVIRDYGLLAEPSPDGAQCTVI